MALSEHLTLKLKKRYEPSAMVALKYKGNDLSVKTDHEGNALVVFIGKRSDTGIIRGERYVRTLRRDQNGNVIKDHWERKGKV
jgi:hypothetical protein